MARQQDNRDRTSASPQVIDQEDAAQSPGVEAVTHLKPAEPTADDHKSQHAEALRPAGTPAQDISSSDRHTPRPRRKNRIFAFAFLIAAILIGGGWLGYHWVTVGRFIVTTDDAYVGADNTTLASKVSGYVSAVEVHDNAEVHTGDVIARIDAGDYKLTIEAAKDRIASQQATIDRLKREVDPQLALVDQAKAQVLAAEATRTRAQLELNRQEKLAKKDFASSSKLETARAKRDGSVADLQSAKAAVVAARGNVGVLKGKIQEAMQELTSLNTALDKAKRDYSFTVIRAPIDGMLSNRAVQVGDYVTTGSRIATIVPLDQIYIDANFKETQVARVKPDQSVDIYVDALPGRTFEGTVESLAPASGAVFSLLPPDNATGNFTKVVQRMPVRVRLPKSLRLSHVLRPGMSVVVDVHTKALVKDSSGAGGNGNS